MIGICETLLLAYSVVQGEITRFVTNKFSARSRSIVGVAVLSYIDFVNLKDLAKYRRLQKASNFVL